MYKKNWFNYFFLIPKNRPRMLRSASTCLTSSSRVRFVLSLGRQITSVRDQHIVLMTTSVEWPGSKPCNNTTNSINQSKPSLPLLGQQAVNMISPGHSIFSIIKQNAVLCMTGIRRLRCSLQSEAVVYLENGLNLDSPNFTGNFTPVGIWCHYYYY